MIKILNLLKRKATITSVSLTLAFFTMLAFHFPVFKYAAENMEGGINSVLVIGGAATIMVALNFFIYYTVLYLGRIVGKVILALSFICDAVMLYFVVTYETLVTDEVMGNVFNTRFSEAEGFFSFSAVMYVLFLGVLPGVYLFVRKFEYGKFKRFMSRIGIALLVTLLGVVINVTNFTWIDRHSTILGSLLMPWSYIVNTVRHYNALYEANRQAILLPDAQITSDEKEVFVLIIGESARRDHFSLYGYEKKTNPLLEKDSVTALVALSSSTYTTAGVKAILDHKKTGDLYEILPNYLDRTGVDVIWRTANWGEPPVYIDKYYQKADIKARYPEGDENYDGILLDGLYEDIMASDKNKVLVVLHTSTSHGPTYFEKYPSEFEVFSPVCTTVEMSKADHDELMNAYDNTIVYTDYLIHSVIEILGQISDRRSCMLYVSDHGESLGENNLYMHGVPMMMAPKEQIEIPFIVWNSDPEQKIKDLEQVGHYHVFHSVLHFLDIDSPVYDEEMNIFSHEK
ncbi:MAG: phosphoethanolamine--lipid A transferase EptA [Flavobacteriales bacterium]|nr:phosphoethanolamine--lipid A transferase EptA [Flavobacteriales bacterium]